MLQCEIELALSPTAPICLSVLLHSLHYSLQLLPRPLLIQASLFITQEQLNKALHHRLVLCLFVNLHRDAHYLERKEWAWFLALLNLILYKLSAERKSSAKCGKMR